MTKIKIPRFSIIIPVMPEGPIDRAVKALKKLEYPDQSIEVILALGYAPSKQRNKAARVARGEILYFLDNDSEIHPKALNFIKEGFDGEPVRAGYIGGRGFSIFPGWISRLIEKLVFSGTVSRRKIVAVGGPNIWEKEQSMRSALSGAIMESFFLHGKMAARYRPIGKFRQASEKELILCNLAIERRAFQEVKGFNEALYPNEENELLNRLTKRKFQLIYHPSLSVMRPRRETLSALNRAVFHYGRGRMEQIRVEGIGPSLLFLTPLVLLTYFLILLFYHPFWLFIPLLLYSFMAVASAAGYALRIRKPFLILILPMLFLIAHLAYAAGLIRGYTTNLKKRRLIIKGNGIKIIRLKGFDQGWQIAENYLRA